jgi:predicted secreted protein
MAEIINLRQARKNKARADKQVRAEQNRITFGRTKAEKELTKAERELEQRRLDSHKRDDEKP